MCSINLAICGEGRAGKDTVANWLQNYTTLQYDGSTSEACATLCYEALKEQYGYADVAAAFADRHNHRREWAECIWQFNQPDGLTLYRDMVGDSNILNGIRRAGELQACVDAGIVDLRIWIDRDVPKDESCEIDADDCDIVIRNHGALDDLHRKLERFARTLGILA